MTTTRRTEWQRLEDNGAVRYTVGEYRCVCDKWHVVKRPMHCPFTDRNTTLADRIVAAARSARMRGCPHGNTDKRE